MTSADGNSRRHDTQGGIASVRSIYVAPDDDAVPAGKVECADRPITVWASGLATPLRFADSDARLPADCAGDQTFGQEGWDVAFDFRDADHLGGLLAGGFTLPSFICGNLLESCGPILPNQVVRLAVMAHGGPGGIDIDAHVGQDISDMDSSTRTDMLNVNTLARYDSCFDQILRVMAPRGKLILVSCLAGMGDVGETFVQAISNRLSEKEIWVVAFRTILYSDGARQAKKGSQGAACYPGARETHYITVKYGTALRTYEKNEAWNDLKALPWADDTTPHATIACKGVLLRKGREGTEDGSAPQ